MKKIMLHECCSLFHIRNDPNTCLTRQTWTYSIQHMSTIDNKHDITTKLTKPNISSWWLWYWKIIGFSILEFTIYNICHLFFLLPSSLYCKQLSFSTSNIYLKPYWSSVWMFSFVSLWILIFVKCCKNRLNCWPAAAILITQWIITIRHTLLHRNIVTKFVAH